MDENMTPTGAKTADGREWQEHVNSAGTQSQQFKTMDDSTPGLREAAENVQGIESSPEIGLKKNL